MAFHLFEDTWETSSTAGTGDLTLAGAVPGWRSFSSQYSNGDTCHYSVYDGQNFEHGIGTYNSGPNTLSRNTVLRSSNGGSLISFPAGVRQVVVSPLGAVLEGLMTPTALGYPRRTGASSWVFDAPGQIGNVTATNDNAATGRLGEYVTALQNNAGTFNTLATSHSADITTMSLTAGDWDVWGMVNLFTSGTFNTASAWFMSGWVGTASVTGPAFGLPSWTNSYPIPATGSSVPEFEAWFGPGRYSFSATTTLFLSCSSQFIAGNTGGTITYGGAIFARRVR